LPQVPGWPSTVFLPQTEVPHRIAGVERNPVQTILIQVPPVGQELIQPGGTNSPKMTIGGFLVVRIIVDIPAGVTSSLTIDGAKLLNSDDQQGIIGQLEVGDISVPAGITATRVEAVFTNFAAGSLDARYWLVAVPL
jgi:hypothetical protein